jgi:8-oxo-dGTP diphosphatase
MTHEYVPPTLVVDAVIFQIMADQLCVLLIQRAQEPFKDVWALPGGYNPEGEITHQAFRRVLLTKAGIDESALGLVEQLYTFDTQARDPRGHAVSVTYMGLGRDLEPHETATTQNPQFFPVDNLPDLAYDHGDIIKYAHERLGGKITHTTAISKLLPEHFTFAQLQAAYEIIFERQLDKRNFRKKFLSFDVIAATDEFTRLAAHRPAQLFVFVSQDLQSLARSFD